MNKSKSILIALICLVINLLCYKNCKAQIGTPAFQPAEYVPNIIKTEYINRISSAAGNANTAVAGASISNSLKTSTEVGMVWSTNPQPDYAIDPHSQSIAVANVFTANLSGLSNNTTYYVCSYAIDNNGRYYYGDPIKFRVGGVADGKLNYTTYSSPIKVYADDMNEMDILLDGGTILGKGTANANPLINFTNGSELTAAGVTIPSNRDDFSIFLQGFFIPKETGSYIFTCEADDADDLYVDGLPLIIQYGAHSASALGTHTASISLTAGVKYAFRARMQERAGQEVLQVAWKSPSVQAANGAYVLDATEISSF